jgi:deazaflavin-dependent oxidoreductase (nitroreductase family)
MAGEASRPKLRHVAEIVADPEKLADPDVSQWLRGVFRRLNRGMVLMFRLGLEPWFMLWPAASGVVLVLVHTGRRTGRTRRTPLNYAIVDGDVHCLAGFGPTSDWYRNVLADPSVEVWMPDGWWAGEAEDVSDRDDRLAIMRAVLVGSGFAARVFGIPPELPDDRLASVTRDYRLIRIRRTSARTGPGGPDDLAWVWPVLAAGLLRPAWRGWRRRRRREPHLNAAKVA